MNESGKIIGPCACVALGPCLAVTLALFCFGSDYRYACPDGIQIL